MMSFVFFWTLELGTTFALEPYGLQQKVLGRKLRILLVKPLEHLDTISYANS